MKTPTEILNRYGADPSHICTAIRDIRVLMDEQSDPAKFAAKLISELTGEVIQFDDVDDARIVTQHIVQSLLKGEPADFEAARVKAVQMKKTYSFAFVEGEEDPDAPKTAKAAKKGGRDVKARQLYDQHVVSATTPMSRKDFIQVLVKELDMTPAGASTYHSNCKKHFEKG